MAQLPPKIPNTTPNWPELSKHHHPHHHRMSSLGSISTADNNNNNNGNGTTTTSAAKANSPYWVDEFLDFSSAKRNAHRRSASDSATYLEKGPMPVGGRDNNVSGNNSKNEFQRFDDEQFMSLFADEVSREVSNPSTPSDHNSLNDQKQRPQQGNETEEVESTKEQRPTQGPTTTSHDRIVDPKRVKRILANRQSAQRSRVKKLQYISELERSITSLQAEVSVLSPRVAFLDHQRLLLNVDNSALKQRIAALQQDKIFKEAHQEALKREIERLMQVHQQQQNNLKSMENPKDPPLNPNAASNETELMLNV